MANVPILTPTPYTPPPTPYTPPPTTSILPPSNAVKDLLDYLDKNVRNIPTRLSYRIIIELRRLLNIKDLKEEIEDIYDDMKRFDAKETESALCGFAKVYTVDGKLKIDPQSFMDGARENLTEILRNNRNTKVKLALICYLKHEKDNIIKTFGFHSHIEVNLEGTDEDDIYFIMTERTLEKIAKYIKGDEGGGSGWPFYKVDKLELHTTIYKPLRGETWIPLPEELANKKAFINMKNEDNKCFLWCVLRALNPKDNHPEREDKDLKLKEKTLNMEEIEYPVSLKDIDKFDNQNQSICIIVFGYDGKIVYPLRNSNNVDREHKIRLMLIEEDGVKHYCLIKNIGALLSSQVSKHNGKHHFCDRYLNPFRCEESLNKHLEYCSNHKAVKIKMPGKGTILKFINYHGGKGFLSQFM